MKYSLKLGKASLHRYPVDKNFAKIALSRTVFEIQAFFRFVIFVKTSKIQNGHHFWWDKTFLKTGSPTQQSYPVGQNFCLNRSI